MIGPLADRARPRSIDEVCGQQHLLARGKVLRRIIETKRIPNLIFYGPSGVGKTTVANIIADICGKKLYRLNATTASTSDIKAIISDLGSIDASGGVLLYLDEIQYFNKKQQQILLQYIESGDITLIASTTENPFFYVYNAILSRSTVFEFKQLSSDDILSAVKRAVLLLEQENNVKIEAQSGVLEKISRSAAGDVRRALNSLELCFLTATSAQTEHNCEITAQTNGEDANSAGSQPNEKAQAVILSEEIVEQFLKNNSVRYDREGDEHYDIISAYQKSMRGSDADAALHYLARLLAAGDIQSACRRLLVCASEDVGLAYPQIIPIVKAAVDTALQLGLPEARIPLADAVILVANSPKSNSGEAAINLAMQDVERGLVGDIPRQLQNKHFDGAESEVKGQNYLYPHDYENHYVKQQYLPDKLKNRRYYTPSENKTEQGFAQYWEKIKK